MRNRLSLHSLLPHWPFLTLTKVSTMGFISTQNFISCSTNACKCLVKLIMLNFTARVTWNQPRVPEFEFLPAKIRNFSKNFVHSEEIFQYFVFFHQRGDFQHLLISNTSGHCCEKFSLEVFFFTSGCNISALLFQVVYLFSIEITL